MGLTLVLLQHYGGCTDNAPELHVLATCDTVAKLEAAAQEYLDNGGQADRLFYSSVPGPGMGSALLYKCAYRPLIEWHLA